MAPGSNGWFRRRSPRLSGTLHIRDATGRELVVPLRGRAALLTTGATRLRGHGEVWAVHTTAPAAETSLMIIYGRAGAADLNSGLCAAGQTIALDGVTFTWRAPSAPVNAIPHQRTTAGGPPRNLRTPPARSSNTRSEPASGLRSRLRNMVRVVTQATRH
ncbi:hypothetical protein Q0Z83_003280 [Actinoplanes sichuanensis]|uniref:Uncharacterized protein n=1 Tax=Actinoplanes sichuanensis TaxID=512349 RepID=A0ABW4AGU3_9ACTN|nr:hypothetical protein [Actinoplanes sichuanensis]BEL02137.1 hypothetical protein Q0Z83_003280 [Actinoplanes sichuanensis]